MINVHKKFYSYITAAVFDEVKRFFEFLKRHEYKALHIKFINVAFYGRRSIQIEEHHCLVTSSFTITTITEGLILEERKQVPRLFMEMLDSRNIHDRQQTFKKICEFPYDCRRTRI